MSVTIYMLENEAGLRYVGSTTNYKRRLYHHGRMNIECTSVLLFIDDLKVTHTVLETCEPKDRAKRERYWIEHTDNVVNHHIPGRSHTEYQQANRERCNQQRMLCYYKKKAAAQGKDGPDSDSISG